jgi:DNA topoisomerase-1
MDKTKKREIKLLAHYFLYIQLGGKNKWTSLKHNGVYFPPEYIKHNIPLIYDGKNIILPILAEEYATLYSKYIDSEYIKNKLFNKNFWNDWKKTLIGLNIIDFNLCDFSLIQKYLQDEKNKKDLLTREEKNNIKQINDKIEEKYKICFVDGKEQPVGNYKMEPPGIFLGRGNHPKLGSIKRRIYPEDIIINIGQETAIPEIQESLREHKWKKIIHDNNSEWIASWQDTITKKIKYVRLGNKSDFKANNDLNKFDLARQLGKKINKIRKINNDNLNSDNIIIQQLSLAFYLIDNFALRIGNEKGKDEADTVGVTSLRIEHVELLENETIKLDFLGKDSIRFNNKLKVLPLVYTLIKKLMDGKNKNDQLLDLINSNSVNKYLQEFMKNLTAKVFRTYNASYLYQQEINKINKKYKDYDKSDKLTILLNEFNEANLKVAILCNHQKNVNKKNHDNSKQKIIDKINDYKKILKKLNVDKKKNKLRIQKYKDLIKKIKFKKDLKEKIKKYSLGTSKTNYIDPRITVAFSRINNIPIEKILSKEQQSKFFWAFDIDNDFQF